MRSAAVASQTPWSKEGPTEASPEPPSSFVSFWPSFPYESKSAKPPTWRVSLAGFEGGKWDFSLKPWPQLDTHVVASDAVLPKAKEAKEAKKPKAKAKAGTGRNRPEGTRNRSEGTRTNRRNQQPRRKD